MTIISKKPKLVVLIEKLLCCEFAAAILSMVSQWMLWHLTAWIQV